MPDQITNYQCPACGGPLHFSNATQDLACDYCGSHFPVAQIEALYAQHDASAAAAQQSAQQQQQQQTDGSEWEHASQTNWAADGQGLIAYNCPSCGAQLICDQTTAAGSCPYCGNPTIIPGQLQGMLKPDYVIPFKLDKNAAMEALRNHYKGKKLLPNSFKTENHIEEVKGVYVPFWLFDGEAYADLVFDATRSHVTETRNERITTTEHYKLHRAGRSPWTAPAKCRTTTWTPSSPLIIPSSSPSPMPICPAFMPINTTWGWKSPPPARTIAPSRPRTTPCANAAPAMRPSPTPAARSF